MIDKFEVRYTEAARADLLRAFDYLLEQAQTVEDFEAAQRAVDTIRNAIEVHLGRTPFIYRKVGSSPFLRELIIPFGSTGYVALYEVSARHRVDIVALRHQREDDYH